MILRVAKKALNEFGPDAQFYGYKSKLTEEMNELNEAILNCSQHRTEGTDNVEQEMADVLMMLIQAVIHFKLSPWRIYKWLRYKAKRTDERIDSGHYKQHVQAHYKTDGCKAHSCTSCVDGHKYETDYPCNVCQAEDVCFWRANK